MKNIFHKTTYISIKIYQRKSFVYAESSRMIVEMSGQGPFFLSGQRPGPGGGQAALVTIIVTTDLALTTGTSDTGGPGHRRGP